MRFGDVVRLNTERCANPAAEGIERFIGLEHLEPGDLTVRSWGLVAAQYLLLVVAGAPATPLPQVCNEPVVAAGDLHDATRGAVALSA